MSFKDVKQSIRERIWKILEEKNIADFPRPVYGRIPNFKGSDIACRKVIELYEFKSAKVIKINPDSPQRLCRELTLRYGKLLIMPTPRIKQGFLLLNPRKIPQHAYSEASTIKGAFKWGEYVKPWDLPNVDLVIIGSVAVNPITGHRLGKSHGYAEFEWGILSEFNKVNENTPIITTVHDVQIIYNDIPKEPYDVPVDIIVTPTKIIRVSNRSKKPLGILWEYVKEEHFKEIPILKEIYELKVKRL